MSTATSKLEYLATHNMVFTTIVKIHKQIRKNEVNINSLPISCSSPPRTFLAFKDV